MTSWWRQIRWHILRVFLVTWHPVIFTVSSLVPCLFAGVLVRKTCTGLQLTLPSFIQGTWYCVTTFALSPVRYKFSLNSGPSSDSTAWLAQVRDRSWDAATRPHLLSPLLIPPSFLPFLTTACTISTVFLRLSRILLHCVRFHVSLYFNRC